MSVEQVLPFRTVVRGGLRNRPKKAALWVPVFSGATL